ncbi:MAG TPA: prepilin-type N-terminal cleavage/methylation domain-containing protein [Candidatus Magasanikbacteria bacterium]|nr:prepilin-type N-terminal cleavage/methylation domain-containing protein [Candidatus Magasanikbacteria bacterium]
MNKKGFTLIELILYISVVGIISLVLIVFLGDLLESRIKNQTIMEVEQQGQLIMQRVLQAGRNAIYISSPATSTSGVGLTLVMASSTLNPTIFGSNNGSMTLKEDGLITYNLNNDKVFVSNLSFSNLSRTGTRGNFRVSFTVSASSTPGRYEYEYSKNFIGSASLR